MITINQSSKTSDSVTGSFFFPADPDAQVAWQKWQDALKLQAQGLLSDPIGLIPWLKFSVTIPDGKDNLDGDYVVWLRRFNGKEWLSSGGLLSATDEGGLPNNVGSFMVTWDGQDYNGKFIVATSFSSTITSMGVELIYQ